MARCGLRGRCRWRRPSPSRADARGRVASRSPARLAALDFAPTPHPPASGRRGGTALARGPEKCRRAPAGSVVGVEGRCTLRTVGAGSGRAPTSEARGRGETSSGATVATGDGARRHRRRQGCAGGAGCERRSVADPCRAADAPRRMPATSAALPSGFAAGEGSPVTILPAPHDIAHHQRRESESDFSPRPGHTPRLSCTRARGVRYSSNSLREPDPYTLASAWSMSAMRSGVDSTPQARRTRESVMPQLLRRSGS